MTKKLKNYKLLLLGVCLVYTPLVSNAQNWQILDNGVNNAVVSLFADTLTNRLYAGKQSMGSGFNCLEYWNGSIWDTLAHVEGSVRSITNFQGDIIIAHGYIEKWNGTSWQAVGSGVNDGVMHLYNDNDNYLYAMGWIDTIGGIPASKIAKWDGATWSAVDTTIWIGGAIDCAIMFQGDLYIGGNFMNSTGTISRIARWDGTQWYPVGTGITGGISGVYCFEEYNNELYIAGLFSASGGNPGNSIAKWNGTQWFDVGGGITAGSFPQIRDMKVFNNELYAGGIYTNAGGAPINDLAKWNGTDWCGLGVNYLNSNSGFFGIETLNNELYLAGAFKDINNDTLNYVAKWIGGSFVDTCGNTTGVSETEVSSFDFNLYPNPTNSSITLSFETNSEKVSFSIMNYSGQIVMENRDLKTTKGKNEFKIDLNDLSNGIYLIQVQTGSNVTSKKIIKN